MRAFIAPCTRAKRIADAIPIEVQKPADRLDTAWHRFLKAFLRKRRVLRQRARREDLAVPPARVQEVRGHTLKIPAAGGDG